MAQLIVRAGKEDSGAAKEDGVSEDRHRFRYGAAWSVVRSMAFAICS